MEVGSFHRNPDKPEQIFISFKSYKPPISFKNIQYKEKNKLYLICKETSQRFLVMPYILIISCNCPLQFAEHPILLALENRRSDRLAQEFVKKQKERCQD